MSHLPGPINIILDSKASLEHRTYPCLVSQGNPLLNLLTILGYSSTNPPLANLLKEYHQLEGEWIVVSPIRWEATHNDAQIVALGEDLDLKKSDFEPYYKYLAQEDKVLFYHNAYLWLLKIDNPAPIQAKPPYQLLGKPLMPELAQLDPTMYWQKFITESQMFFASHGQNKKINGLWLWGNSLLIPKSIEICADISWYPLAKHSQAQVSLYDPSLELKKYSIVLLNNLDSLSQRHQNELTKMHSNYYWNNIAYSQPKTNFMLRLWRHIFHAN